MSQDAAPYSSLKLESKRRVSFADTDAAADYLRTYHEWRVVYGLQDSCINELRMAILAASECDSLSVQQRDRLEWLARMIRREQDSAGCGRLQ